jgi:phosphonate transport system permease protein
MSTSRIDETLRSIERGRVVRQVAIVAFVAVVAVTTYYGLEFVRFEWASLREQVGTQANFISEFFPIDFVNFTVYSTQQEIHGFQAVLASFQDGGAPILQSFQSTRLTLVRGAFVTLLLGFLGTVIGFPLALTFGVLGSERVVPFPFNFLFRGTMSGIRAIPAIVWVFIYAPLVGINPSGAVLAVGTDTIGNLGRLFTDELEEIDEGPIEAIRSTGAGRAQVISFGMLSQVFRSFIAWTLYILEINVRIAIGLGIVGAGGIGLYITNSQDLFRYQQMAAGIVMVFVIVISVELISSRLRARLRPGEHESRGLVEIVRGLGDLNKWFGGRIDHDTGREDDEE